MSSSSRRPTASPPQTPPRSIAQLPNTTSPLSPISPWPPLPPPLTSQPPSTLTSTTSIHTFSSDPLPTAKEAYGSLTVLLTYLTFLTYLLWSLLPTRWLETIGWSWFPDQQWALVVPSWMMILVLLAYWSYAGITAYLTPRFDSISLITDRYSNISEMDQGREGERYYWKFADEGVSPEGVDLPLDLVNRVLYPPRKRRKA